MSLAFLYPHLLWLLLLVPLSIALIIASNRARISRRTWYVMALRGALLTLLILAIAGVQLRLPSDTVSAVFILDVSDSIPEEERERGEGIIHAAIETMPLGDKAAVVIFGRNALVERLAIEESLLQNITSIPITSRTDIASALQLAFALFPEEGGKRVVLLSDGKQNLGTALSQAELASALNIELVYVPLRAPLAESEVLIVDFTSPTAIREGQSIDLEVNIESTIPQNASLRIFDSGDLIYSSNVRLLAGENRLAIPVEDMAAGFHRFSVQVVAEGDTRLQNNESDAFTIVKGQPLVLLVENSPQEGRNIEDALTATGIQIIRTTAAEFPNSLEELLSYEAVVLINVPSDAIPTAKQEAIVSYVKDMGRGLLMIGGENSYGAGGYLRQPVEQALPLYMDVRSKEEIPNLALVLAVDKSGSMGRCHCDNPDLEQTYQRREIGQPKVDIAKEAIMSASSALGWQDMLGVVAFDSDATWSLELAPMQDYASLESAIGGIQALGQTNMEAGIVTAYNALIEVEAQKKHIILMTDGWVQSGDIIPIAEQLKEDNITLSVIAAGGGSAEYLAQLSDAGGGAYYPAVDIFRVPEFFLKETVRAVGEYIIEEPFYPIPAGISPFMQGVDGREFPALLGYNGTTLKNAARLDIVSPRGDPILASWQYGLGRAAAWTSDMKGQWATAWIQWEQYPRFTSQLVSWLLPSPSTAGLDASTSISGDKALIHLDAVDTSGSPWNFLDVSAQVIDDKGETINLPLIQVAPGEYEAAFDAIEPGTHLIRLGVNDGEQSLGQETLGLVVPYSTEYRESGTDESFLQRLAQITGGGELPEPTAAFLHNLPQEKRGAEIWRQLLTTVLLLFVLDIAVRRVTVTREDLRIGLQWVREKVLPVREVAEDTVQVMGQLFRARDRTRHRRTERDVASPQPPPPSMPKDEDETLAPPKKPKEETEGNTMSRLQNAKKRAKKDR